MSATSVPSGTVRTLISRCNLLVHLPTNEQQSQRPVVSTAPSQPQCPATVGRGLLQSDQWGKLEAETDSSQNHGLGQGHIVLLTKTYFVLLYAGFFGGMGVERSVDCSFFFFNTTQMFHFSKVGNENMNTHLFTTTRPPLVRCETLSGSGFLRVGPGQQ